MIDPENFPVSSTKKLPQGGVDFVLGFSYCERRKGKIKEGMIFRIPVSVPKNTRKSQAMTGADLLDFFIEELTERREDWAEAIQRYMDYGPADSGGKV